MKGELSCIWVNQVPCPIRTIIRFKSLELNLSFVDDISNVCLILYTCRICLFHTTYTTYTIHLLIPVYIHSLHILSTLSFVITARTIYKFNTVVLIFLYYSYGPQKCESQQSPIVIIYRVGCPRVTAPNQSSLKKDSQGSPLQG